jgi:hypothetical protein
VTSNARRSVDPPRDDLQRARGHAGSGSREQVGIDHGRQGVSCQTWRSHAESQVERGVFLDHLAYSIALDRAKVQRLGGLGAGVADLALAP